MTTYTAGDLDFQVAFDVIPSQDPEVATRFYLPIPNWESEAVMAESGNAIEHIPGEGLRYKFYNYTDGNEQDGRVQHVKVDGSAAIVFKVPYDKAKRLLTWIQTNVGTDCDRFSTIDVYDILSYAHWDMGINDIYDASLSKVLRTMHRVPDAIDTGKEGYGPYLPNPHVSAAIYIPGVGSYIPYPDAEPQVFGDGAYISFPGLDAEQLKSIDLAELTRRVTTKEIGMPRLVQADVFEDSNMLKSSRKFKAGQPLPEPKAAVWQPRIKPEISQRDPQFKIMLFRLAWEIQEMSLGDIADCLRSISMDVYNAEFNDGNPIRDVVKSTSRQQFRDMALGVFEYTQSISENTQVIQRLTLGICAKVAGKSSDVCLEEVFRAALQIPTISEYARECVLQMNPGAQQRLLPTNARSLTPKP